MTIKMRLVLPAAIAMTLTLASAISFARAAEVTVGELAIVSAWARATPPGAKVGGAYVTVENRGDADDRLLSAASPVARSATPHQTIEENGIAKMRPLEEATVPAGGRLEMQPGATHMMLTGLSAPLKEGEHVPVTLVFETAGSVTVELEVAAMGADAPAQSHPQH